MISVLAFFVSRYRARAVVLLVVMTVAGALESISIAALYPLMAMIFDPSGSGPVAGPLSLLLAPVTSVPRELLLAAALALFLAVVVATGTMRLLREYLRVSTNAQLALDLKKHLFAQLVEKPYAFFLTTNQGDLLYRLSSGPLDLSYALLFASHAASAALSSAFLLALLFSIEWRLTLGMVAIAILFAGVNRFASGRLTGRERQAAVARELGVAQEFIAGAREIAVAGAGPVWAHKFAAAATRFARSYIRDLFYAAVPGQIVDLVLFIGIGIAVAAMQLVRPVDVSSLLPVAAVYGLTARQLIHTMSNVSGYYLRFASYRGDLEAMYGAMTERHPPIVSGTARDVIFSRTLAFDDVSFQYPGRPDAVLGDVSFDVPRGQLVAVVGASGAGKTTLLGLVLRLSDPTSGRILVDGRDLREFDRAAWLASLGYVGHEVFLYGATAAENIAFGSSYTDEEIKRAAVEAHANPFISALPSGYATELGDRGMTLSAGERQRIALARALIRKPQLLVLDEATSALDTVSEKLIQQTLNEIRGRCTVLLVAHRLSTVRHADRIVVLEAGRVVEQGDHESLIRRRGAYHAMVNSADLLPPHLPNAIEHSA